jgi:HSP20 family protein
MNTELTKIKKDNYNTEECVIVPPVDIYENENEYIIKAEMPGIKKEAIEVTLEKNELEIHGKTNGDFPDEKNLKYAEFTPYNYHRTFNVGDTVDGSALSAGLENGILTVTLPKKEEVKPKEISVSIQ